MKPLSIDVHIQELVLHGFPPSQRHAIAEAVERGLAQMLVLHDVPRSFHHQTYHEELHGGSFHVKAGSRPQTIGTSIARSIYKGLNR
jgi:hypothetical protein